MASPFRLRRQGGLMVGPGEEMPLRSQNVANAVQSPEHRHQKQQARNCD
jgi:hypothetical protein